MVRQGEAGDRCGAGNWKQNGLSTFFEFWFGACCLYIATGAGMVTRPHRLSIVVSDRIWLVSYMDYDLFFDHETGRFGSAENPFAAKVLPMCPV